MPQRDHETSPLRRGASLALVGLAAAMTMILTGCGSGDDTPAATVTVTESSAPPTSASASESVAEQAAESEPAEDPRCDQARTAVHQPLTQYWRNDVLPQIIPVAVLRGLTNFADLYQLGMAELGKYDCVVEPFDAIASAYALIDPQSPLMKVQMRRVTQALDEFDPTAS